MKIYKKRHKMGSFNMKCGASDISIGSSAKVAIIPLITEKECFKNEEFIKTEKNVNV